MLSWSRKKVVELEKDDLCGFIFKSNSPSSGMERVKVYDENGVPAKKGVGMFAKEFMEHFPLVPAEDEGRLNDPVLRDNFIERIFVFKRWRDLLKEKVSRGNLTDFHTRHKLLILSHSQTHYRMMGGLVAKAKEFPIKELSGRYHGILMEALRLKATQRSMPMSLCT